MNRRKFLKFALYNVAALPVYNAVIMKNAQAAAKKLEEKKFGLDSKLKSADELRENETLVALVETIVPGKRTDPLGNPGAYEADVFRFLEANYFDGQNYARIALVVLNIFSVMRYGKGFKNLDRIKRERLVRFLEIKFPFMVLLSRMIRCPFFCADFNTVGTDFYNWPGPNFGYFKDPTYSYRRKMSPELTEDGRMP